MYQFSHGHQLQQGYNLAEDDHVVPRSYSNNGDILLASGHGNQLCFYQHQHSSLKPSPGYPWHGHGTQSHEYGMPSYPSTGIAPVTSARTSSFAAVPEVDPIDDIINCLSSDPIACTRSSLRQAFQSSPALTLNGLYPSAPRQPSHSTIQPSHSNEAAAMSPLSPPPPTKALSASQMSELRIAKRRAQRAAAGRAAKVAKQSGNASSPAPATADTTPATPFALASSHPSTTPPSTAFLLPPNHRSAMATPAAASRPFSPTANTHPHKSTHTHPHPSQLSPLHTSATSPTHTHTNPAVTPNMASAAREPRSPTSEAEALLAAMGKPSSAAGGRAGTAEEQDDRRLRRLLRNRVSAQQARERRKAQVQQLQEDAASKDSLLAQLSSRVGTLEAQNQVLRRIIASMAPELEEQLPLAPAPLMTPSEAAAAAGCQAGKESDAGASVCDVSEGTAAAAAAGQQGGGEGVRLLAPGSSGDAAVVPGSPCGSLLGLSGGLVPELSL